MAIPVKQEGFGSGANGGELVFLSLATCYCNDIYRETKERGVEAVSMEVEAAVYFRSKGAAAENILYGATVTSPNSKEEVLGLIRNTDTVAEIHKTPRRGVEVVLSECIAGYVRPKQKSKLSDQPSGIQES